MNYWVDKTVLIISPEAWGLNFVSKHHYALELVKKGSKVYFLNPPVFNQRNKITLEEIKRNLYSLYYRPELRGINRIPLTFRNWFNGKTAALIQETIKKPIDIIWSFDPYRFQDLRNFEALFRIYHPVDIHHTNLEKICVKSADIVISTSNQILKRFFRMDTPLFQINHGLADYFINPRTLKKSFIRNPKKINVGLVGNLHYRYIDCEILTFIIRNNSEVDFYFIGPTGKSNLTTSLINEQLINFLDSMSNVFLLGSKPSENLPAYLKELDLFLICYTGDKNVAEMANPHKILEYLSTGKPIVSHYVDEYKNKSDLIQMAHDNKDLAQVFSETVENIHTFNTAESTLKRISFAKKHTYEKKLRKIEELLNQSSRKMS
jgi:glycosyltransferase involved in cell wall biosynthesis